MYSDIGSSRVMLGLPSLLLLLLVPMMVLGQEETSRGAGWRQTGIFTLFGARIEGDEWDTGGMENRGRGRKQMDGEGGEEDEDIRRGDKDGRSSSPHYTVRNSTAVSHIPLLYPVLCSVIISTSFQ